MSHNALLLVSTLALVSTAGAAVLSRRRHQREYARFRLAPYRTDQATTEHVIAMLDALHRRVSTRWPQRLIAGQPSVAVEVHWRVGEDTPGEALLAVCCPVAMRAGVEAAVRSAYPSASLQPFDVPLLSDGAMLRLRKRRSFIHPLALPAAQDEEPRGVERLLTAMSATREASVVQLALTPAPSVVEGYGRWLLGQHERRLSDRRSRGQDRPPRDRSEAEHRSLQAALEIQRRPLFAADIRVAAKTRAGCEAVADALRSVGGENELVVRGWGRASRRLWRLLARGEGEALALGDRTLYAAPELVAFWHLPRASYVRAPMARTAIPSIPASPQITRAPPGRGLLRDDFGAVTIDPDLRRQNTAVPGTVEQGKTSYLVATIREDLRRERCAVILLDPKGDAADAAVSVVPGDRACTVLDIADPTCGFNPLAVDAGPDTIADFVVAAMRNLFDEGDIRASSDRYLRNAIIAVLAYDRRSTLWDAIRLLSVTEEGYAFREFVGERIRGLPEFKEIGEFFTQELRAQLQDARGMTTSKLDAPVNKAARLLNSPSVKRVLLNTSLRIDLDAIIAGREVLIVKGALGAVGEGNTSVLMQLLVGMLDAALARQQDLVAGTERIAVALKVDEAPLVINRGFAQTMALKRSAGLETVACWQSDAQWTDPFVREQLDALFAHRVYFATASTADARQAAGLLMGEFADQVRPDVERIALLARPDARLHLPRHHAIASWVTAEGRQPPFLGRTMPIEVNRGRLAAQAARQHARGGRRLETFRQPHWDRADEPDEPDEPKAVVAHGSEGARAGGEERPLSPRARQELDDFADLRRALRPALRQARATAAPGTPPALAAPARPAEPVPPLPSMPAVADPADVAREPPITYTELAAVDEATRVTWPRRVSHQAMKPRHADLELLAWLAKLRFALATQIHRRFHAEQSYSTTQRHLRRLSQAGWVNRFQYFCGDGTSSPLVYVITAEGIKALAGQIGPRGPYLDPRRTPSAPATSDPAMRRAQHDLHVNAWVLALQAQLGAAVQDVRGPTESYLAPPHRTVNYEKLWIGPSRLQLPGGRTPHGFLETNAQRQRVAPAAFRPVEPDATIALRLGAGQQVWRSDLFVEMDRTFRPAKNITKFERYDHLISGWATMKDRYAKHCNALPLVVFVCREESNAREFCRAADAVVTAAHAYGGEYAAEWDYPGRGRMFFVAERDLHEGAMRAYALPELPPEVRVNAANGDRRAGSCHPRVTTFVRGSD